ncbi:hypothetical protein J6590_069831 [Homalodisca vitripennis]|nr:hypothetical protein J6590_069831 [Homalodisca vitripennis]
MLSEILKALEDNYPHNITDEASGEEDSNDPDRVCRRQLQAEAVIRFEGIENDEDTPGELGDLSDVRIEDRGNNLQIATHSKATGKRKPVLNATHEGPKFKKGGVSEEKPAPNKKMNPVRNWEKGDLEFRRKVALQCEIGPPVLTDESHPLEFFQCFMPEDLVADTVKFSVTYAVQKNF